jgi:hypothetical protein
MNLDLLKFLVADDSNKLIAEFGVDKFLALEKVA